MYDDCYRYTRDPPCYNRRSPSQRANDCLDYYLRDVRKSRFLEIFGNILVGVVSLVTALSIVGYMLELELAETFGIEPSPGGIPQGGSWLERCKCPSIIRYVNGLLSPGWGNKDARISGKRNS